MARSGPLDLLLVNPGNRKQVYQQLGVELSAVEPPVWTGMIATFIRNRGFSVRILDANAEGLTPQDTARAIQDIAPVLTVVVVYGQNPSASTMVMPAAGEICREIKEVCPESRVLLAGGHVAALPLRTLQEEGVDFVCDGEGPYTVLELLSALKSKASGLAGVRGLVFRQDGEIIQNPPAPLVTDLDREMPEVAWDLLPTGKCRAHNWHCFGHLEARQPYASLYTTLGCPFSCDFCCIQAPFKRGEAALGYSPKLNSYRRWSPGTVMKQIDVLVTQYQVKNIKFADEIFVLDKKHVTGICDLLIERRYPLNIWAYARVDSWDQEMLDKMKLAGVNWLCLGIESGSDRVRTAVHKGYKAERPFKAIEAIRKSGIYTLGNYIFGLPEDDLESMTETLELAIELNCEFANFYCAMAYPGSQLYDQAIKENWPLPRNWGDYSQYGRDSLPLPTKYLGGLEVLKFRDAAFQQYFTNPSYLHSIEKTFGLETVRHIQKMTSYKLERAYH